MVAVSSAGGLILDYLFGIVCLVCAIVTIVGVYRRWPVSAAKAANSNWPDTEGTIQSVYQVIISAGRATRTVDVGDFSYKVNNEFYSGRATISGGIATGDRSPKELVDQKVRVLYDPEKPENFFLPEQHLGEFLLNPFAGVNATDVDPIDLNIA